MAKQYKIEGYKIGVCDNGKEYPRLAAIDDFNLVYINKDDQLELRTNRYVDNETEARLRPLVVEELEQDRIAEKVW